MPATIEYTGRLVVLTCWCGIKHAVPQSLRDEQMRQHHNGDRNVMGVYCPMGHQHVPIGEGRADELERRLERERARAGRLASQRDQAEASARAYKGVATRTRRRAQAGVCPCCKRTFKQLQRHMASQHPGFKPEAT